MRDNAALPRRRLVLAAVMGAMLVATLPGNGFAQEATGPYTADWDSLKRHEPAPEWFRDAKFGIYFHWGPYSVPEFGNEWYPRTMHDKNAREYRHHVATYGDPTEFGYHDFIPMFTAEHFDAEEWADLFAKAGARYAGPVAEHHDGFSMWASELTPWNAKDMGPKRDIVGEMAKAVRARDMRFVATFHHARNSLWQKPGSDGWTGHYEFVKRDFASILEDPVNAILYGYMPRDEFLPMWYGKLKEVIDNYQPDLMWFDFAYDEIPDEWQQKYLSYYFNQSHEWGRPVVVTTKQDLDLEIGVDDWEKGRADRLLELPWLTDDTLSYGSWSYTRDLRIKPAREVIQVLADIVSKNGQLLLNVSPKFDGTIPDNQRQALLEIGQWLEVNGEGIFETRPWVAYGEGPTRMERGGHFVETMEYSARDIRFTRSKDGKTLYMITLGWPESSMTVQTVKVADGGDGKVELLGHGPVEFAVSEQTGQMTLQIPDLAPDQRPSPFAHVFKVTGMEFSLHPDALFGSADAITLEADKAVLEGSQFRVEERAGQQNIGYWDQANEKAHWLAWVRRSELARSGPEGSGAAPRDRRAGNWAVRVEYASTSASRLTVEVAGDAVLTADLPATGSWDRPAFANLGTITFDAPGVYQLTVRPADRQSWNPINLFQVQLAPAE